MLLSQIVCAIADLTASAVSQYGGELSDIDVRLFRAGLQCGVELVINSTGGAEISRAIVSVLRAAADAVEQCAPRGEGYGVGDNHRR